jgi:hypothetical protein
LFGELVRTIRCGQIGSDCIGVAASFADLSDYGLSFGGAAAIVNKNLGAILGEGESASAAHATGGSGDEGGLT